MSERVYKGWQVGGESRSYAGRAAWRDASWLDRPGRAARYHMVAEDGGAECSGMALVLDDMTPERKDLTRDAAGVPEHLRCQRHGCKERWP